MSPSPANAIGAVNQAEFAGVDPTSAPVGLRPRSRRRPSPIRNQLQNETDPIQQMHLPLANCTEMKSKCSAKVEPTAKSSSGM